MFWTLAIAISVLSVLIMTFPLLKQKGQGRVYALALVVAAPMVALGLYQGIGSPEGIDVHGRPQPAAHASQQDQFADMIAQLEQRLVENPADLDGWLLLGRSYKTTQQYQAAETALLRAFQLAPENPQVMVELAEAKLFASGQAVISDEIRQMLEQAVTTDPFQQKALWLLGIAAGQSGETQLAINYWERLLSQMEPGSQVAASVQQQLDNLTGGAESTEAPEQPAPQSSATAGFEIVINLESGAMPIPDQAVLYVIARDPSAPQPPLAVRRIEQLTFPLNVRLADEHSMMATRPLSAVDQVELLARISMSGNPVASAEDLASAPVQAVTGSDDVVTLLIQP